MKKTFDVSWDITVGLVRIGLYVLLGVAIGLLLSLIAIVGLVMVIPVAATFEKIVNKKEFIVTYCNYTIEYFDSIKEKLYQLFVEKEP